jgi:hypothetical protein
MARSMQCKSVIPSIFVLLIARTDPAVAQDCPNCGNPLTQPQFSQSTTLTGGWRLVKSRDPNGGGQIVSIMHAVDMTKSDFGLAGLSLRCGAIGLEAILILLDRVPSTPPPAVTLQAGETKARIDASVLQDGRTILLPFGATTVSNAAKKGATEVSVTIETQPQSIAGVVPITGLLSALNSLSVYCPPK